MNSSTIKPKTARAFMIYQAPCLCPEDAALPVAKIRPLDSGSQKLIDLVFDAWLSKEIQ